MTLIKTGGGVTDIRGGFGGGYFHRDKSGLHSSSKPRTVHRRSAAQKKQRDAFIKARSVTKDPRWVSYYIYRALNDLPFLFDAIVTGDPDPDCTGKYILAGKYFGTDYYERTDSAWAIWYIEAMDTWFITEAVDVLSLPYWVRSKTMQGLYEPGPGTAGNPVVKLELCPPPLDYQIPKL